MRKRILASVFAVALLMGLFGSVGTAGAGPIDPSAHGSFAGALGCGK